MELKNYNHTEKLLLVTFFAWAGASFLSNSLLAIHHLFAFLTLASFYFYRESKNTKLIMTFSSRFLLSFVVLGIVSVLVNYSELIKPVGKIFKLKYLVVGVVLSCFSIRYKELLRKQLGNILSIFLLSFFVAMFYGYVKWGLALIHEEYYRPSGFFGLIMSYTYAAQIPILLLFFLSLNPKIKLQKDKSLSRFIDSPLFRISMTILGLLNLYLGQARGAVVGVLLSVPLLLFWKKRAVFYAFSATALLVFGFLIWNSFSGFIKSENRIFLSASASTNEDRLSQYQMAIKAFEQSPVIGVGWRSLDERCSTIKKKFSLPYPDNNSHAHNNILEVLATTGVFGLIFYLLWLFCWFWEACIKSKSVWRAFYLATIFVYLVSGMVQSTLIDSEFSFTLFAFYAMTPLFEGHERDALLGLDS